MNKTTVKITFGGFVLAFFGSILIYFWANSLVLSAFAEKPPLALKILLDFFYPRFSVEKYRFSVHFFELKIQQLAFRLALVSFLGGAFCLAWQKYSKFRSGVTQFWDIKCKPLNIKYLQIFLALILLYCTWDWVFILIRLYDFKSFYQPVFLLKIFSLPFPEIPVIIILYIVLLIGIISLIFNYLSYISIWITLLVFLILQGYLLSFHKIDHTYATLTYALLGMPFLLYSAQKAQKSGLEFCEAWALRLIQVAISMAYFLAGLEKVLIGGFEWFLPSTLQTYLQMHHTTWGLWLAQFPLLCSILAVMVVFFELIFPLGIIYPKLLPFILISGVFFHLSTYFFLNAGGLVSAWWLLYVFFIDWDKIFGLNINEM